jgi:murein DD-endopeptidase MepM/ murein hydrolase activator NlpD
MTRAFLLLALLSAACAASGPGAPISYGEAPAPASRRTSAPQADAPAPQAAPDWADGEGTALSEFALRREDAQPYDPARPPRTHRVGANESLYDIATRYQAPLRALIDQNRLEPPYALTPGAEIELPPPRLHRVARGESFADVARAYHVDPRSLALLNRMSPPYDVRPGDAIVLPAMARSWDEARAAPAAPPPAPVVAAPAATAGAGRFAWPVRGEILARFGARPGGGRIDGLEIAGEEGAPIGAASDGDVVYAGSDLPGYGTLVLVRHADGYVTAYGYARRALVREGQAVRAGAPLAEIGRPGEGPARLLFQVRRGREAVDPLPLLGGG